MTTWRTIRGLRASDRLLLAEAVLMLLIVRIGLYLLPFTALRAWLCWHGRSTGRSIDRVVWAVNAISIRWPGTTCLAKALVMDSMLRRHGYRPTLKIGVRPGEWPERGRRLDAHAWVECDGVVVAGASTRLGEYAVLS